MICETGLMSDAIRKPNSNISPKLWRPSRPDREVTKNEPDALCHSFVVRRGVLDVSESPLEDGRDLFGRPTRAIDHLTQSG